MTVFEGTSQAAGMRFGVLTTEDLAQALARAGSRSAKKGFEAATGAIEMATLLRGLEG